MATIRKKGNGWQAIVRRKGHPAMYETFPKKVQAERWARDIEKEMVDKTFFDASKADAELLGAAIRKYRDEITPNEKALSSVATDKGRLNLLDSHIGHKTLGKMTREDVFDYAAKRLGVVSSDSVRKELQLLSKVFTSCNTRWRIPCKNPVPAARAALRENGLLRPGRKRKGRFPPDKIEAMLATQHKQPTVINELVEFLLETAMRRGEALALTWADLDFDLLLINIRASKSDYKTGKQGRMVPMSDRVLNVLKRLAMRPDRSDNKIFGLTLRSATQAFQRLCEKNGVSGFTLHQLRHEAVSRLFEKGLGVHEVAQITGHDDIRTLMIYTHPKIEEIGRKLRATP